MELRLLAGGSASNSGRPAVTRELLASAPQGRPQAAPRPPAPTPRAPVTMPPAPMPMMPMAPPMMMPMQQAPMRPAPGTGATRVPVPAARPPIGRPGQQAVVGFQSGGGVMPLTAAGPVTGSPITQNYYNQMSQMPMEQLQKLAVVAPGNPAVQRALQVRKMTPAPAAPMPAAPPNYLPMPAGWSAAWVCGAWSRCWTWRGDGAADGGWRTTEAAVWRRHEHGDGGPLVDEAGRAAGAVCGPTASDGDAWPAASSDAGTTRRGADRGVRAGWAEHGARSDGIPRAGDGDPDWPVLDGVADDGAREWSAEPLAAWCAGVCDERDNRDRLRQSAFADGNGGASIAAGRNEQLGAGWS
jgi:hypothetical protein